MRMFHYNRIILFSAKPVLLVTVFVLGFFIIPATFPRTFAAMAGDCSDCHDLAENFSVTFHGRAWNGMKSDSSCQSCHGGTDKHVNEPSSENIISFKKGSSLSAHQKDEQCLSCHNTSSVARHWDVSAHNQNDVSCVDCHAIHTSKSHIDELTVCFTCHRAKRGQISKRSHHPIKEGKIKCSDCHDPHGSKSTHGMIRAENVNQLCYKCHPDKRGPYVYEHPPVMEDCTICHKPHGSRHAKLLTEKVPNLCQDCHDWSRHPGTPYDANAAFTGRSPSNRFFSRSCVNCHGAIHGSTSFEFHGFTR